MSFRGFTLLEIMSISTPWITPEHPERLSLQALLSTAGMIRFIEAVHADVLAVLTDEERARLGLLRDNASLKNVRHDDLARIIYFCLRAHEYLLGDTPEGRAVTDVRTVMFPDDLYIVRASYRESGARATARTAQLTDERMLVLADVPVRNGTLLSLTLDWNQVALELGNVQDQRVTPLRPSNERNKRRTARDRWIRVIKTVLSSLQLEAEEHPEAQRILDRVDGVRAEVRRRLRASNGNAPEGDDEGADDGGDREDSAGDVGDGIDVELGAEPGQEHDELPTPAAESR
jgi:hypothetical protein